MFDAGPRFGSATEAIISTVRKALSDHNIATGRFRGVDLRYGSDEAAYPRLVGTRWLSPERCRARGTPSGGTSTSLPSRCWAWFDVLLAKCDGVIAWAGRGADRTAMVPVGSR